MRAAPVFALVVGLWLSALARDAADRWVAATVLPPLGLETSVEVADRDGRLLRAYTVADGRWRLGVAPGDVDPAYVAMLVNYEDRRFYRHGGVDLRAMARAVAQAAWNGRVISGGSTLSMQVARLLEDGTTGEMSGKLRQMRVALALERRLGKDRILGLYMNLAPFGGNLEGVRAATLSYFGKEPRRLTPAEAALLVALPQAPESRRPDRAPDRAEAARARVLDRAEEGGLIDADQAHAARTEPVPRLRRDFPALAPHLADRVRAADPAARRHVTTLDAPLQASLQTLAAEAVAGQGDRLQVALLVADHRSGEILASVGSADYRADARQGFVDMTMALRSPGSTLKPLVYALAFDEGLAHPETLIEDRPVTFAGYAPQNFDRTFHGMVRVREALQLSLNIPVVVLTDAMGPARLLAALRRAGLHPVVPGDQPGLAIALGGVGVTLQDMVQLYAMLARGGVALPLHATGGGTEGLAGRRHPVGPCPAARRAGEPPRLQDRHQLRPPRCLGHRVRRAACGGHLDGPGRRHAGSGGLWRRTRGPRAVSGLQPAETPARPVASAAALGAAAVHRATARAAAPVPVAGGGLCAAGFAGRGLPARWRPGGTGARRAAGAGAGRAGPLHLAG